MADVRRRLTRPAVIAVSCLAIWAFGLLFMWIDFHFFRGVWTIGPGDFILPLAMMIAAPTFLFACISMLNRKANKLPVFLEDDLRESGPRPVAETDPLGLLLWKPPEGAAVRSHRGRRVIVLADGSAIGEMMNGSARRFDSFDAYCEFVGT
jgi:hypothetical protein